VPGCPVKFFALFQVCLWRRRFSALAGIVDTNSELSISVIPAFAHTR
jgi:hypothetical protein